MNQFFDYKHAAGVTRFEVLRPHRDCEYFECAARKGVEGTHHFIGGIQIFHRTDIAAN